MNNQQVQPVILIIDDQPSNVDILAGILQQTCRVLTATSAEQGLQIASQRPQPDVILLDIIMPGMDGYTACKKLKNNPDTANIPVMFLTADTQTESEEKGLKLGAVDYITKPFNPMLINARIKNQVLLKKYQDFQDLRIKTAIDELKSEREKLAKSEKLYRSLLESAPDTVMLVDQEGLIKLINHSAQDMFGYAPDELVGKNIEVLIPERFLSRHKLYIDKYVANPYVRKVVEGDLILGMRKDGSEFPVDITLSPVELDDRTCIIADIRDLSDYENMQKQINQVQKMEAVGQLTSGIAHDFNNILNSVLGFTHLLINMIDEYDREKILEYLNIVNRAGERAKELVKQMLTFSRSNYGTEFNRMSIEPIIKETIKMARSALPSSVELTHDFGHDLTHVMMDPMQISQAIMNVVINASDAMNQKGKIQINMSKRHIANLPCNSCHSFFSGEFIDISISDEGDGITQEVLARIFEPFFTTKEVGKGSGMGLSVVHGIVHGHHGHIIVETGLMKGSCFRLFIPVMNDSDDKALKSTESVDFQLVGNNRHVLIVDDDTASCLYIETLLLNAGFKVSSYYSSVNALEYFNHHSDEIDLLISDLVMPKIMGDELADLVMKKKNDLPVILISGNEPLLERHKNMTLNVKDYLVKPFTKQELFTAVGKSLDVK